MSTTTIWPANFKGHCHLCGYAIRVGVDVTWHEERVVHAACLDIADVFPQHIDPCPRCWTMRPATGVCDCRD